MKEGPDKLLEDWANDIVDDAVSKNERLVTRFLSPRLVRRVFPKKGTPLQEFQSYRDGVQVFGIVLRHRYGTSKDPIGERHKEQLSFAEFGDKLQDRYPVPLEIDGEEHDEYKLREELTEADVEYLCRRMRKVGDGYYKHADQLERWFRSSRA